MKKIIRIFFSLILVSGCIKQKEKELSDNNLNSTLWMQTAAEYQANAVQVYQTAATRLEKFINDTSHTAVLEHEAGYQKLAPAIILDVDETVLDNSAYQATLLLENKSYDSESWNYWIRLKQARPVPGVVDFLNKAQAMGVTVFYVTNRRCTPVDGDLCPQDQQTFENLQAIGINNVSPENVMLRDEREQWTADKTSRRAYIANTYRVIMLFGDNLGDFIADTAKTIQARSELVKQHKQHWGYDWFMLANPTYGGWQDVLAEPAQKNLETY